MPFLGPGESHLTVKACFNKSGAVDQKAQNDGQLFDLVARYMNTQRVVGWFQGRMEFCPRALGNRSILADPGSPDMQDILNYKIKFRKSFRPFAPVVLSDRTQEFCELDPLSPYMLFATPLRGSGSEADAVSSFPAVTHVDGSARIQTVSEAENPRLFRLLEHFEQVTGCSILVNTSFNVRGEPMVYTADDAYRCFMKSGIDVLVVEQFVPEKTEQPLFEHMPGITRTRNSVWQRLHLIWLAATYPIRWLLSKLVLSLILLLVVTPIGYGARTLNRLSTGTRRDNPGSYWKTRFKPTDYPGYFKQY